MLTLYMDNFRGFFDTFVPLRDVNFLVGENSTGKTSLLSLFALFSSQQFWFNGQFNTPEIWLGNFADISKTSTSSSMFRIGYIAEETSPEDHPHALSGGAALLTFVSKDGLPTLSEFFYTTDEHTVAIQLQKNRKQARVKIEQVKLQAEDGGQNIEEIFSAWLKKSGNRLLGAVTVPFDETISDASPILLYIFTSGMLRHKRNNPDILFPVPPMMLADLAWKTTSMAPIRAKPKPVYTDYSTAFTPEGAHVPYLLQRIYGDGRKPVISSEMLEMMSKFGQLSGLYEEVTIKPLGKSPLAPFELLVSIDGINYNIANVGYGVSQVLPLVIQAVSESHGKWMALQQPEVHLHPRAQAAYGEILFELHRKGKNFIIETHSDYIIDRFRLRMQKDHKDIADENEPQSVQVLFFDRKNGRNTIHSIVLSHSGEYPMGQPESFRQFFIEEEMKLLGV